MTSYYLGVDVGTGSARAGLFDASGTMLASAKRDITIWREAGSIVEQSSVNIWQAVCESVREAVKTADIDPTDIAGIGYDATCSLVVLGEGGKSLAVGPSNDPARDIIVWMDHRAVGQAERINATKAKVLDYVGSTISPRWKRRSCCGSRKTSRKPSLLHGSFSILPIFSHGNLAAALPVRPARSPANGPISVTKSAGMRPFSVK